MLSGLFLFWKNASIRQKRFYSLIFIFVLSVAVTFAGTLMPLSAEEANILADKTNQVITDNPDVASLSIAIFTNNFMLCLLMFIPIFGVIFGMIVLFSTGVTIGALSMVQGLSPIVTLLMLMITPIFWIEFASYTLGMSESGWLFRRLTQKRWSHLKWTAIFIGLTAILLAIGAVVEAWFIIAVGV